MSVKWAASPLEQALALRRELQAIPQILGIRLSTHGLYLLRQLLEDAERELETAQEMGYADDLEGAMPTNPLGEPIPIMIDPELDVIRRRFGENRILVDHMGSESVRLTWWPQEMQP